MRERHYRIESDPDRRFMKVTLWGDWTTGDTEALAVDHAKAIQAMKAQGVRHGTFLTLVDMLGKLSDQGNSVADFRRFLHNNSPSRRLAIVARPVDLPAECAAAIGPPDLVMIFEREADGMAWLWQVHEAASSRTRHGGDGGVAVRPQ